MEKTTPSTYFGDIARLMDQFKVPGLDIAAHAEARRKDIAALTEANRIAFDGVQSLAVKQAEIVRSSLQELGTLMQKLIPSPAAASAPAERVGQALQTAFANVRALAEAGQKSQADAFDVVKKRVEQNMEELKGLLQPKQ